MEMGTPLKGHQDTQIRDLNLAPVDGAPTTRMIECTECDARSPFGPPLADFARWAFGHAAATGHHNFQRVTTELLHTGTGPAGADPAGPAEKPSCPG
ncbi:DUF7848 domain-containing protein [Streptomyces clavuligerus]|nr:hypothetical protein [Streptomyces clavuligerus]EDY50016.1 hypothetical protein SSCG_03270 [Streptomyces clavuligerus]WDN56426.1 hypothetical protein LL058_31795 [Streptomyces clavuligerus]